MKITYTLFPVYIYEYNQGGWNTVYEVLSDCVEETCVFVGLDDVDFAAWDQKVKLGHFKLAGCLQRHYVPFIL